MLWRSHSHSPSPSLSLSLFCLLGPLNLAKIASVGKATVADQKTKEKTLGMWHATCCAATPYLFSLTHYSQHKSKIEDKEEAEKQRATGSGGSKFVA